MKQFQCCTTALSAFVFALLLSPVSQTYASSFMHPSDTGKNDITMLLPPIRGIPFDELPHWQPEGPAIDPGEENEGLLILIAASLTWLGTPYRAGGFSHAGVDCSGFMHLILSETLSGKGPFPRQSAEFIKIGKKTEDIRPGDILIFAIQGQIYHVGLALSPSTFIHTASEGDRTGVIISSLYEGNWRSRLFSVRRLWD